MEKEMRLIGFEKKSPVIIRTKIKFDSLKLMFCYLNELIEMLKDKWSYYEKSPNDRNQTGCAKNKN